MNLTIEGDLANRLFVLLKKDRTLARSFAHQWANKISPNDLHSYLLTQDAATDLLVLLLQKAPEKTLADLHALAEGKAKKAAPPEKKASPRKKRGPGRPRKVKAKPARKAATKPARKAAAKAKTGARIRLTAEQAQAAKDKITKYLRKNAWATRKELTAAADLPTQAAYMRVVRELLDADKITAKGERSKRVYGLRRGRRSGKN